MLHTHARHTDPTYRDCTRFYRSASCSLRPCTSPSLPQRIEGSRYTVAVEPTSYRDFEERALGKLLVVLIQFSVPAISAHLLENLLSVTLDCANIDVSLNTRFNPLVQAP